MTIKKVKLSNILKRENEEGLVIQGCAGDPKEWMDAINKYLQEFKVFVDNTFFEDCFVFTNEEIICILFPFNSKIKIDIVKMAIWRLKTREVFGSMWLSDYIDSTKEHLKNKRKEN